MEVYIAKVSPLRVEKPLVRIQCNSDIVISPRKDAMVKAADACKEEKYHT